MGTSTSYELYPLEKYDMMTAMQFAIPSRSVLGQYVKFGVNDKGQTIFQYIDPDTPHIENVYEKNANGSYKWDKNYNLIPVLNPDGTQKTQIARWSDGTPVTNRTELARNGDSLAISDDGRSLMSTVAPGYRSITGMGAGMGYHLTGSGMNEMLSFSGQSDWGYTQAAIPAFGIGNIPVDSITAPNYSAGGMYNTYANYLAQFKSLAQGVNQRIKSKTVTDEGVLGDIKDTIGKLGPLAPLALSFALPGVGTAIGAALGASGAAAAVIGNTLINTALNGGDLGSALTSSLIGATGFEAGSIAGDIAKGGELGSFLQSNPQYLSNLASNVTQAALKGQDIESVLGNTLFGTGVSMATAQIPGYNELSPTVKASVDAAVTGALQGKDVTAAAINAAIKAGQSAMATSTNVPTEAEALKQQQDLQANLAGYEDKTAAQEADTTPVTPAPPPETPTYPPQEMQITPENLRSYQDTLSENFQGSQWQAGEGGDYTLTADDGSTVTMHQDGSVSSTPAPSENLLDTIGKETTGGATAAGGGGGTTAAGGAGATQTPTTPAKTPADQGYSSSQLQALGSLLDQLNGQPAAQEAPQAAAAATGPQTYAPSEEASYLDALGKSPEYYKSIDPETLQLLQQMGIDPAELMAQQEAEGGAEDTSETGEEGADTLEAPGGAGGFRTREGIKRGLPAGTLGIAGSDVAKAYGQARADQGFDTSRAFKLPIDNFSPQYMAQLAKAGEAALGEQWGPYIGGRQLAASGQPSSDMTQSGNTLAYVPSASIGQYKGFTGALAPQLVAMVGKDPELLNDPDYLAAVLGHELSHQPQQDAGQFMRDLGVHPGKVGAESTAMSSDIASAIPYLAEKYGYKGFYDTKSSAPLNERLADIGGWQMQNQVNLTQDPIFKQQVLNTPERMAVYNAMMPQRGVQIDPSFPPVGQLTLEDFGGMNPPIGWAYRNLSKDQFQDMLKKRLAGMFGQ